MRTGTALGEIVEELSYFGLLEHCATLGIDNSQVAGTITHLRAMTVHGADYWFPRRASLSQQSSGEDADTRCQR